MTATTSCWAEPATTSCSAAAGVDTVTGGDGLDVATLGSGNDVFVAEVGATKIATKIGTMSVDIITDFDAAGNDLIDLSNIDQLFTFRGTNANKNDGDLTYKTYNSINGAENALGIDIDGQPGASGVGGPVTVVFGNVTAERQTSRSCFLAHPASRPMISSSVRQCPAALRQHQLQRCLAIRRTTMDRELLVTPRRLRTGLIEKLTRAGVPASAGAPSFAAQARCAMLSGRSLPNTRW